MNLKLIDKKNETDNKKTFTFETDQPITWTPGQYLIYSLPHENEDLRGKQRFFTISNPPFTKHPSITTRIEEKPSSFKKSLDKLIIGNSISAKGPDGDFVIEDLSKQYVFIAGGIGITPFISILREENFEKKGLKAELIYANSDKQILFQEELEEISKNNQGIKVNFFNHRLSKEDLSPFINEDLIYFVSGPDPMVESTEAILKELGLKDENLRFDYFSGYENY